LTISVWVRHDDFTNANNSIVSKIEGHNIAYNLRVTGQTVDPDFIWFTGECGNDNWSLTGTPISDDTWYHIVAVRDGDDLKLYINGSLQISDTTNLCTNLNNSPVYIGVSTYTDAAGYNGAVDDVRIYNRALSDAEIATLFNASQ
jgi:hypothetical protein